MGPALGAGLIVFLKNFVSLYTKRWLLILGGVYICVILFAPGGIIGALRGVGALRGWGALRRWRRPGARAR